ISSLLTLDPRFEGVRIQCVRLHDRAIRRRGSPGSGKLDHLCIRPYFHATHLPPSPPPLPSPLSLPVSELTSILIHLAYLRSTRSHTLPGHLSLSVSHSFLLSFRRLF